jgi:hypothetical protein
MPIRHPVNSNDHAHWTLAALSVFIVRKGSTRTSPEHSVGPTSEGPTTHLDFESSRPCEGQIYDARLRHSISQSSDCTVAVTTQGTAPSSHSPSTFADSTENTDARQEVVLKVPHDRAIDADGYLIYENESVFSGNHEWLKHARLDRQFTSPNQRWIVG